MASRSAPWTAKINTQRPRDCLLPLGPARFPVPLRAQDGLQVTRERGQVMPVMARSILLEPASCCPLLSRWPNCYLRRKLRLWFYSINLVSIVSIESRNSTDKSLLYWPAVFALLRKATVGRLHLVCRMLARLSHSATGESKQEAAKYPAKFLGKPGLKPTTGHRLRAHQFCHCQLSSP